METQKKICVIVNTIHRINLKSNKFFGNGCQKSTFFCNCFLIYISAKKGLSDTKNRNK